MLVSRVSDLEPSVFQPKVIQIKLETPSEVEVFKGVVCRMNLGYLLYPTGSDSAAANRHVINEFQAKLQTCLY